MSQGEIHAAVQASTLQSSCSNNNDNNNIPSLYPLLHDRFAAAQPNLVITQDLCAVCAPTRRDVEQADHTRSSSTTTTTILSLSPTTLTEVADSFVTIATACGVPARGHQLRTQWEADLSRLRETIVQYHDGDRSRRPPRMLLLEWLDPPFTGGHWTDDMMADVACIEPARVQPRGSKSTVVTWNEIQETIRPDVILVGCCGFDLERNVRDAQTHAAQLRQCTTTTGKNVFCCNGNRYVAQPSPTLLQGAVLMAKCAYYDQPDVIQAIDALDLFRTEAALGHGEETAWCKLDMAMNDEKTVRIVHSTTAATDSQSAGSIIPDVEDLLKTPAGGHEEDEQHHGFHHIHQQACDQGLTTYEDPATGYSVFTALAHRQRGWCCGSGCRHCPYSHANVKSKASKIQQPAVLYRPKHKDGDSDHLFSITHNDTVKVLFFSGGKDSFLTLRKLVRQCTDTTNDARTTQPFGLVLLTTFDATTRKIAHQDILIDEVIRQAEHLRLCLVGVPLRRGSGEPYTERIQLGLEVIRKELEDSSISALVFGDLHLEHIREWRDKILPDLGYTLEYPLWKVPYAELMADLEASQVPCYISGTSTSGVDVGTPFDRELFEKTAPSLGVDRFGESGEFHSIAQVWQVSREVALGIPV